MKGNRSKASGGQSMDVDLSQDIDQDITDLTSSDASHMMCDADIMEKVSDRNSCFPPF